MRMTGNVLRRLKLSALVLTTLAVGSSNVFASPLVFGATNPGVLNIGNFSVFLNNSNCIDFFTAATGCPVSANANSVAVTDQTLFGALGTTIVLADLPAAPPIGSVIITDNFGAGSEFYLLGFSTPATPVCTAALVNNPPISCVVPGSPFLFNESSLSPASTSVQLTEILCGVVKGTTPGTNCSTGTLYQGVFTSQFNLTIPQLLAAAGTAAGVQGSSTSATLVPNLVPEPMSFLLLGSGLACVGLLGRRSRMRRNS